MSMSQAVADSTSTPTRRARIASTAPPLPLPLAIGLAAVAGGVTLLAFPKTYWWPMAPVGVALFTLAVLGQRPRVGALLGAVYAVAFFPTLLFWVRVVGWDAWGGLSVIETLYLTAMGAFSAAVSRLRWWPAWLACLWVLQEFVRARFPLGGFSWGRLAFGETQSPYTPLAALGGASLVTFAVALTGTLLAWAVVHVSRQRLRGGLAVAGALALAFCGLLVPSPAASEKSMTVAVIQGNVPRQGLDFLGQREAVLKNHAAATHQLAADVRAGKQPKPDFVVWPENASDVNPFEEPGARRIIESAVADVGVPVLIGTLVKTPDGKNLENTGIVWDPKTGPGERYVKQHLVPFGEYIPFRPVMTKLISRIDEMIPADMRPGTNPKPLSLGGHRVGDVMCFDVAFDDAVGKSMKGASLLTVQTNNATYGGTLQLDQQFSMSRLRAVEYGRPVAIAATSGISAVIEPDGDVRARTEQFTRDVLVERLPVVGSETLAQRLGPWPERILALVGLCALGAAVYVRRRRTGEE